uniref:(northern house mosquito) hypothetical protein n=1 Tax=Culex pipiens TaxID=7175 RepID=A0A8D8KX85_CULPI
MNRAQLHKIRMVRHRVHFAVVLIVKSTGLPVVAGRTTRAGWKIQLFDETWKNVYDQLFVNKEIITQWLFSPRDRTSRTHARKNPPEGHSRDRSVALFKLAVVIAVPN